VFWAFRIMVGTAIIMLIVSWTAAWNLRRRGVMPRPLAMILVPMTLSGWLATLAGWYTTEVGRQPWLVTGVLRTAEAVGPVPTEHVALTLTLYTLLYIVLIVAYLATLVHLSLRAAREGDEAPLPGVLNRPLSQPAQDTE
jgi:cytochrome bd ubiquinol oxidase subunit I